MSLEPSPTRTEIAPGVIVPNAILRFTFARSSGPGGQNVNKLNTKAILTITLDDLAIYLRRDVIKRLTYFAGSHLTDDRLIIAAEENRSQLMNKKACLERVRRLILQAMVRPKKRKRTRPSRAMIEARLRDKKRRSKIKQQRANNSDE